MKKIEIKNLTFDFPLFDKSFKNLTSNNKSHNKSIGGKIIFDGKKKYLRAIDNLSLEIKSGDKIAILGHNGSGKTTLLSILSGVYPVNEGNIIINGNLQSYVSPLTGVDIEANCIENLKLILRLRGFSNRIDDELIIQMLKKFGLGDYIYFPVKFLSSGMKTRLSLISLDYLSKDILLLDEWISTIDKNFELFNNKNFLLNKNLTLIFATHSEKLAKKYCEKFLVLEKGMVTRLGNIENVSKEYFNKI